MKWTKIQALDIQPHVHLLSIIMMYYPTIHSHFQNLFIEALDNTSMKVAMFRAADSVLIG